MGDWILPHYKNKPKWSRARSRLDPDTIVPHFMMDSGQLFLIPAPRLVRADNDVYLFRNYLSSRNIQSESIKGRARLLKVEGDIFVICLILLMWKYLWCTLAAHPTGITRTSLSDAWTMCSDCYDSNINVNDVGNYKLLSNPRPLWFSPVLFLSWTSRQQ